MNPAEQRKVINPPPVRFLELIYGMISGKVFSLKAMQHEQTFISKCFGVICHINSYKCTMRAMPYQQKRHIPLL